MKFRTFLVGILTIILILSMGSLTLAKTYTVGLSAAFPPFEFVKDGEIVGIDVEVMNAIAESQDFEVEFKDLGSFDSVFPALMSGHIDVIASGVTITAERKKKYDFSEPYYGSDQSVIVKEGLDKDLTVLYGDHDIGVQTGTTGDLWVTEHLKDKGVLKGEVARYGKYTMVIADLVNENLDGVVLDSSVAKEYTERRPVKVVGIIKTGEKYGIVVKKGNKELLKKINAGLEEIKQSGKLKEIIKKYEG